MRPALARPSLHDPLAFELLEPPADRPARHANPGGQKPLRPPAFIATGPHETDQGVLGRLPLEQIPTSETVACFYLWADLPAQALALV